MCINWSTYLIVLFIYKNMIINFFILVVLWVSKLTRGYLCVYIICVLFAFEKLSKFVDEILKFLGIG